MLHEDEALAVIEHGPTSAMAVSRQPEIVLAEAQKAARALKDVIEAKPKKVVFNNETYLEFEDWQTVGRFYGIAPRIVWTKPVEYGAGPNAITGFEAAAEAVHVETGKVVSSAEAMCLTDEEKWRSRPKYAWAYVLRSGGTSVEDPGADNIMWEDNPAKPGKKRPKKERVLVGEEVVPMFQLRSMAQTRAGAKALRNALAWVVVLAGYKPTPAEEMMEVPRHNEPEPEPEAERKAAKKPKPEPEPGDPFGSPEEAAGRPAPDKKNGGNGQEVADPRPALARRVVALRSGFKTQPSAQGWAAIVSYFATGAYLKGQEDRHTTAALAAFMKDDGQLQTMQVEHLEALAAFMRDLSSGETKTVEHLKTVILKPRG